MYGKILVPIDGSEASTLGLNEARYTDDRHYNFDIYLPEWLAKHNKSIFGALYVTVIVFALVQRARAPS
jgi:hypothetical protein